MENKQINANEIQEKLNLFLKDTGWDILLRTFLQSQDMTNILNYLIREVDSGKRFTPPIKYLFNAFKESELNNTNVVIIGQDPYPRINAADGIAFSCSLLDKPEKSHVIINNAIDKTVYGGSGYVLHNDLRFWCKQGVLLLNSALTTTIGKPGSHCEIWKPFIAYIMDMISYNRPDMLFVFVGRKAAEFSDLLPENQPKLFCSHPASAAYAGMQDWDCNDVFNKINEYLKSVNKKEIQW